MTYNTIIWGLANLVSSTCQFTSSQVVHGYISWRLSLLFSVGRHCSCHKIKLAKFVRETTHQCVSLFSPWRLPGFQFSTPLGLELHEASGVRGLQDRIDLEPARGACSSRAFPIQVNSSTLPQLLHWVWATRKWFMLHIWTFWRVFYWIMGWCWRRTFVAGISLSNYHQQTGPENCARIKPNQLRGKHSKPNMA